MFFYKSVNVHRDANRDIITVSSKPEVFSIVFFLAFLIGLCSLPFSDYRNNYIVYICMIYPMGLAASYFIISIQSIKFENRTTVRVRKGFDRWSIPFEAITGGYTSYEEAVSRASLTKTHYLSFELKVNLPNDKKRWIRNGTANIFHYGFSQWGKEQERIWAQFNNILDEKDIPNFTAQ